MDIDDAALAAKIVECGRAPHQGSQVTIAGKVW
jgi:hypothetical protein